MKFIAILDYSLFIIVAMGVLFQTVLLMALCELITKGKVHWILRDGIIDEIKVKKLFSEGGKSMFGKFNQQRIDVNTVVLHDNNGNTIITGKNEANRVFGSYDVILRNHNNFDLDCKFPVKYFNEHLGVEQVKAWGNDLLKYKPTVR